MTAKSPLLTEAKTPCIACGRECPDGLRYCLYCGGKTMEIDKPTMPMDPHCPECGEEDALNITFCVACGAKLLSVLETSASAVKFAKKTGFNWTLEETPSPATRMALESTNESISRALSAGGVTGLSNGSKSPAASGSPGGTGSAAAGVPGGAYVARLIPVAAGVAAGLLVTGAMYMSGWLPLMLDEATWPKSGLVVYSVISDGPVDGAADAGSATGTQSSPGASGSSGDSASLSPSGSGSASAPVTPGGATGSQTRASTGTQAGAPTSVSRTQTSTATTSATTNTTPSTTGTSTSSGTSTSTPTSGSASTSTGTTVESTAETTPAATSTATSTSATPTSSTSVDSSAPSTFKGVVQISLENLDTHKVTVAPIPAARMTLGLRRPGFVVLKDLPGGSYMMRVQRAGSNSKAFGLVTLVDDKPTVIGYPQGLRLPI